MHSKIKLKAIGIIQSPFKDPKGTPIQSASVKNEVGKLKLFPEYVEGLKDLDGFSHIILLYHFHKLKTESLTVKPFMDTKMHGVFSTRSPARPNHIGLSVVKLEDISGDTLLFSGVDMIDGTPIIDIKPYIPQFDSVETKQIGWLKNNVFKSKFTKDDGRFLK